MTRGLLEHYLPDREPRRYLYDMVGAYPRRGGRAMRPSLCLAAARTFGAPLTAALHTAVSIELLHNAALIHDDIQDESELRRGKPTLHETEGIPMALNAGDALLLLGLRPLMANIELLGPHVARRIMEETARMGLESAEGQALDMGWRRDNVLDLTDAHYFNMVLKKTCWLATILPLRTGALVATRGDMDLDPLLRVGFFLGAAFQIQDDLLNLCGDEARYGKELNGDIREGKRTLMLVHLWRHASEAERREIRDLLAGPRAGRTETDIRRIRGLMDTYGSIDYARQIAHRLAGAMLYEWGRVSRGLPNSRDKRFIERLGTWVIERK
ncbi:MAG: polyprenyl synthetase family protein [Polyangiaceae bacterium]|nr:polyprenyl synthetase family protein [Polyangiaceae bacterium]NUQ74127.1 polyprenyl synthetase family protein [Polyangiaceae bacterium]